MKLPWWRLAAGIAVLGSLAGVLIALAPIYIDNFRLDQYLRTTAARQMADEETRALLLKRAHELDLPLKPDGIRIEHPAGGGREIHLAKYAVQMDLGLYQVDLHFHEAIARSR